MNNTANRRAPMRRAAALLVATFGLAACDTAELLRVEIPGQVTDEDLNNPALALALVNSVIGDLECSWTQYTAGASNHSDEWVGASGNDSMSRWGLRQITPEFADYTSDTCDVNWGHGVYLTLHVARFQADHNYDLIKKFSDAAVPLKSPYLATIRAYGAWPLIAFGETFCETRLDGGPVMKGAQLLKAAEDRFSEAIALAAAGAAGDNIRNMALVGRARARLGQGNYAGAIQDAQLVPKGFRFNASRDASPARRQNRIRYVLNGIAADGSGYMHGSVSDSYRDVRYKGVKDPRIQVSWDGVSIDIDGTTPHWRVDNKHQQLNTPVRVASYEEAQMFIAEAAALTGDLARARTILNDFHTAAGIPAITAADTPTQDDVIKAVIEERRREFFTEGGHRLRDHIKWRGTKFNVPFKGEAGSDHPNGFNQSGKTYGETTCLPRAIQDVPLN